VPNALLRIVPLAASAFAYALATLIDPLLGLSDGQPAVIQFGLGTAFAIVLLSGMRHLVAIMISHLALALAIGQPPLQAFASAALVGLLVGAGCTVLHRFPMQPFPRMRADHYVWFLGVALVLAVSHGALQAWQPGTPFYVSDWTLHSAASFAGTVLVVQLVAGWLATGRAARHRRRLRFVAALVRADSGDRRRHLPARAGRARTIHVPAAGRTRLVRLSPQGALDEPAADPDACARLPRHGARSRPVRQRHAAERADAASDLHHHDVHRALFTVYHAQRAGSRLASRPEPRSTAARSVRRLDPGHPDPPSFPSALCKPAGGRAARLPVRCRPDELHLAGGHDRCRRYSGDRQRQQPPATRRRTHPAGAAECRTHRRPHAHVRFDDPADRLERGARHPGHLHRCDRRSARAARAALTPGAAGEAAGRRDAPEYRQRAVEWSRRRIDRTDRSRCRCT
jgi:hypothetical protein